MYLRMGDNLNSKRCATIAGGLDTTSEHEMKIKSTIIPLTFAEFAGGPDPILTRLRYFFDDL